MHTPSQLALCLTLSLHQSPPFFCRLLSISLFLSIILSPSLSLYQSLFFCISHSIIYLSRSVSVSVYINHWPSINLSLSLYQLLPNSVPQSKSLFPCPSICLFQYPGLSVSVSICLYQSLCLSQALFVDIVSLLFMDFCQCCYISLFTQKRLLYTHTHTHTHTRTHTNINTHIPL